MNIEKKITLLNITTKVKKTIELRVGYDPYYIEILSGFDSKSAFNGCNVFDCFKQFNRYLQNNHWIPLCNGARVDAAISGMLADSSDGEKIYLLNEKNDKGEIKIVDIFDSATEDRVGTILQQEHFIKKHINIINFKDKTKDSKPNLLNRYHGCMWGLACGDAVGTSVEFRKPGSFIHLTDMIGGGPFNLQPGQWTDDTSMALCLASSLIDCEKNTENGFDPDDQVKKYIKWRDTGYMSSTDRCFDIGNTVAHALNKYEETSNPYSGSKDKYSAGNGSIMRLAPIPLYYFSSMEKTAKYSELSSKVTHGTEEAVDACHLLSLIIHNALKGKCKDDLLFNTQPLKVLTSNIELIRKGKYKSKNIEDIKGSGYVVDSLEAALWCFYTTINYEDAVLKAANLGDDADTTAAICGQVAGAFYGVDAIPKHWKYKLSKRDMIRDITEKLYNIGTREILESSDKQ